MPRAKRSPHLTALQKGRRPRIPLEPPRLGERIKFAREKMGLTQAQVALTLGVSRNAIAQWETDRSAPATGRLDTLAKRLGVALDWLLEKLPQTGSDAVGIGMAADLRLLEEARQFGVDLPLVVAEVRERHWLHEHREALAEVNAFLARNGLWDPGKRQF
jgi:transcriptional regulator with XRE-family HTH domain